MIQLNRSIMERYEIAARRPATVRAALFGANRATLGVAARLLDRANEGGGDLGAVCVSSAAAALRVQDGMFTLLVRGEVDESAVREERVVQSVLAAVDPEAEFEDFLAQARRPELALCFLSEDASAVEIALLARFLHARWEARLPAPAVLLLGDAPQPGAASALRAAVAALAREWTGFCDFSAWLDGARFSAALADGMCGPLSDAERDRAQREMNYRDDFLAWAEPHLSCCIEGGSPDLLAAVCDPANFDLAVERKCRIFDALVFLCAPIGFLWGMNSFSEVLRDETLRKFIGGAFFDELLPAMPWPREEISPLVISAFARLENPMNDVPLLEIGKNLLSRFPRTALPAIRDFARREFDAPPRLTLALCAAIMLCAGARANERGEYEVLRGERRFVLRDSAQVLQTFSALAHDMPSESLAYAVLADRDLWGEDLREIDGLELRASLDLSAIQRTGIREALRIVDSQS